MNERSGLADVVTVQQSVCCSCMNSYEVHINGQPTPTITTCHISRQESGELLTARQSEEKMVWGGVVQIQTQGVQKLMLV